MRLVGERRNSKQKEILKMFTTKILKGAVIGGALGASLLAQSTAALAAPSNPAVIATVTVDLHPGDVAEALGRVIADLVRRTGATADASAPGVASRSPRAPARRAFRPPPRCASRWRCPC